MKYLVLLLITFSAMISDYETQNYSTIISEDNFEIRFYESSIKAKVISDKSANGNFYKLFQFISGNNSKKQKIAMTTPVYMKNDNNKNIMEFVMPSDYNLETISEPNDKDITIYKSEPKHYACIRYGGYSNSKKFNTHSLKLINKLNEMSIKSIGDVFFVSYNSPYKVFGRRNEVMVEIKY